MARRVTSATLIGRDEELAAIGAAVAAAKAGEARIVLIGGDAGIGKTRLITEACAHAGRDGLLCAVGGCVQLGEASLPYAPLIEALRGVRRRLGDEEFAEVLGPAAATVGTLLGINEGGEIERSRLFEHILGLFGRLGARTPTLIVFEDLHWADASTRDLVAFLGRNLRDLPVALLLTYRADELHRDHAWGTVLVDLERDAQVERLALGGLGRSELVALLTELSDRAVPVDEILRRTEGNPLYVEELLAAGHLDAAVPATLAQLILARVNRLPPPTPAVLHQAAVLGDLVDDEWLADLTGRPLAVVVEALREGVSHHLLIADRAGFRFRHALMREALYDDLLPRECERLHAAAARRLQDPQPRLAEHVRQTLLAYHAYAAGDTETAFTASAHAGLECERVYALSAAAVQYQRALTLWDKVTDPASAAGMPQWQLLVHATEAVFYGSGSERAGALGEAALAALPADAAPEQAVDVLVRIARINGLLGRSEARLAACERAVSLVADRSASPAKAHALAGLGHYLLMSDRQREAEPVLLEAIEVAEQVDARAVMGHALCSLGCVYVDSGRAQEGLRTLRRAAEISRKHSTSPADVFRNCYGCRTDALTKCGQYEASDECGREGVAYAVQTGQTYFICFLSANRIEALFRAGRWQEAEQVYREATDRVPQSDPLLEGRWVNVLLGQGRLGEARGVVNDQLGGTADSKDAEYRGHALMRAGELAELENRWDEARDLLASGLGLCRTSDDHYYSSWGYASAVRIERRRIESAAGRRGAAEEVGKARQVAGELIGQARDLAARCAAAGLNLLPEPAAWLQTAEAEYAAIRGEDTAQMWANVAETWENVGQPFREAEARYREADALLRQHGDREQVRQRAAAAFEVAERLGAAPLKAEVLRLIQRARLDLKPATAEPQPAAGLDITAREAEVLRLLATGQTNREIAKALFISEKTASVHVSHLLRKLGVGTRVEAAAVAQRFNLTEGGGAKNAADKAPN